METIRPYIIPPWEKRLSTTGKLGTKSLTEVRAAYEICITTSALERGGIIGVGGTVHDTLGIGLAREPHTFSTTIGTSSEQNTFVAELAAIALALE